jgi:hypothetical protein
MLVRASNRAGSAREDLAALKEDHEEVGIDSADVEKVGEIVGIWVFFF